jgi:Phage tail tube protein
MAVKATSAQIALAFVEETTWGTTPGTPTMLEARAISESLDFVKGNLRTEEFKTHRQVQNVIHGAHGVEGNVEFEFGNYLDKWLEAALYGRFTSNVLKLGQTLVQFTVERRLSSIGQAMRYTGVRPNGLTLTLEPDAIAKITFPVMGKTMTTAIDGLGGPSGWLVNNGAGYAAGTGTIAIDTGSTNPAANDQFVIYQAGSTTAMRSDQIYTVSAYSAPDLSFTPLTDVALVDNDILHFVRPATAVTGDDPMDAFSGTLSEGGSSIAIVTGIELNIAQGQEAAKVIGSTQAQGLIPGGVVVTGTLRLYVENLALYNKFVTEGYSTLQFQLVKPSVNTYTWLLPRIKYTGAKINKATGGGPVIQEMPFEAAYDASTELTAVKITKS